MTKRGAYIKSAEPVHIRSNIIERVKAGGWSIRTAEKVAARLGVGPLAKTPPIQIYNPENAAFWTLEMTISWIAWRSTEAVCCCWAQYQAECRVWQEIGSDTKNPWTDLVSGRVTTLFDMKTDEALESNGGPEFMTVHDAQIQLYSSLGTGGVVATGFSELDAAGWVEIPRAKWAGLYFGPNEKNETVLHSGGYGGPAAFTGVILPSANILNLWPEVAAEAETDAVKRALDSQAIGYAKAYISGAPGRPSSMYLVESELIRRIENGATFHSIEAASQELSEWLTTTHPDKPRATSKTIKNKLSGIIRPALDAR